MDFRANNEKPNVVQFRMIDNFKLYMPRNTIRGSIKLEAEKHLRKKFKPGIYSGKTANEISKYMFAFYDLRLNKSVKKISKTHFIHFSLLQYDITSNIHTMFHHKGLTQTGVEFWLSKGPLYRKTIGYLIDKMINQLNSPFNITVPSVEAYILFDECFICSEHAITYSIISNEIHYLNNSHKIKIHPVNSKNFIETLPTSESKEYSLKHNYYVDQTTLDISLRNKYIRGRPFEKDWEKHGKILNSAFKQVFGLSYFEFMLDVTDLLIKTGDLDSNESLPLINKELLIKQIAELFKTDKNKINILFEGLILRKSHFQINSRTIWKYKQPYRINKRPFVEIAQRKTVYLTWSNEMLKERLDRLDLDLIFKNLPPEWTDKAILKSTDLLSNKAGVWFEKLVKDNLNKIGIIGDKIKGKIINTSTLCNSKDVGGFDFLGYSPQSNMIIIIECKYIDPGFEPVSYNDDISDFKKKKQGYLVKFDKKVDWAQVNFDKLKNELSARLSYPIPKSCKTIGAAFFTYVLTFAYAFIEKYPCVSFTEFISNYEKENRWYFDKGIFKIN